MHILLILVVLLLILLGLFIWASLRLGGFQDIFNGESNVLDNAVNNIKNTFSTTSTPKPIPTEFTIKNVISDSTQLTINKNLNTIVFNNYENEYSITIKTTSTVEFINQTGKNLGLQFSDGRQVRIETGGTSYETFYSPGIITFTDLIDSDINQIKGKIIVIN